MSKRIYCMLFLLAGMIFHSGQTLRAESSSVTAWQQDLTRGRQLWSQGEYASAETTLLRALKEAEKEGPDDPKVAVTLNSLGAVYQDLGRFGEAELSDGKHKGRAGQWRQGTSYPDVSGFGRC